MFALDLFRQVRGSSGNVLISPYSVWVALAMLHPGARGPTRDALATALGIEDVEAVRAIAAALASRAEPDAREQQAVQRGWQKAEAIGFHLSVANKLWVQTGYRIRAEYGAALAAAFGVDPAPVDFAGAPGPACDAINRWVDDQTRGRIKDIVSPDALPPALRGLLANAIYFKAGWQHEFNEYGTKPGPFYLLDGTTAQVPIMRVMRSFAYAKVDGVDVVELPYVKPEVAMIVLAPPRGGMPDFEQRTLTAAWLERIPGALASTRIALSMPKFTFASTLSLGAALKAIGFAPVMTPGADLSGISDEPGFGVGEVLHKTFIAVDEHGTEAAAVTAIAVAGAAPMRQPDPLVVDIDRPFYLMIRDKPTGTILFLGRVADPR